MTNFSKLVDSIAAPFDVILSKTERMDIKLFIDSSRGMMSKRSLTDFYIDMITKRAFLKTLKEDITLLKLYEHLLAAKKHSSIMTEIFLSHSVRENQFLFQLLTGEGDWNVYIDFWLKNMRSLPTKKIIHEVYTDGSCIRCLRAGMGIHWPAGEFKDISIRFKATNPTNQRAELAAIYEAIYMAPKDWHLKIMSDSMYSIKILTLWGVQWEKRGWIKADGKPPKNLDIIKPTMELIRNRPGKVTFMHIDAHKGILGNEIADKLAKRGSGLP